VISAIAAIDSRESVPFLQTSLPQVKNDKLAQEIIQLLKHYNVQNYQKPATSDRLFIPDTLINPDSDIQVVLATSRGDIQIRLRPDLARVTVSNFIYLVKKGYYNNISFHRVVSDFVIQAGDPQGTGWGGPGYSIPCEYSPAPFKRGTMGMATAGKDTGGSQFFICHSEQPHLVGRYTVFGQVVEGMDVVDQIQIDDKIMQITILN
jgi:cyclophilin family peptidyl-prolyl cis-trans isomerase